MFDGLLQSKFHNKTKTAIKAIKIRLETIKKKRGAVERYLRKDIADLLKNGLDVNAYGRAEGLLVEQNMTSCYDLIDQFCRCILFVLVRTMHSQRECPEECREAVSSLMHAAAGFADLPELRELRTLFREKYGNSNDAFVNKEFVEMLRSKPCTKDSKLQLMRDIATEFSVTWDSKAFDQKLFNKNLPKLVRTLENCYGTSMLCESASSQTSVSETLDFQQADDDHERKPPHPNKEKERNEKDLNLHPRNVLRDNPENFTRVDVAADKNANKFVVEKQNLSSSSSPSDEEVKQKQSASYRGITPPYIKSKSEARGRDGVNSQLDLPKPKSMRQRKLKQPSRRESRRDSSRTREVDEDDKVMDRLLLHYSKKQSPYKMDKVKGSLKPPHSRGKSEDQEELDRHAAARASLLRLEPITPADATETGKGHCRSASLPPEMLVGHVHPNLPNYSDLAARIASLRGR